MKTCRERTCTNRFDDLLLISNTIRYEIDVQYKNTMLLQIAECHQDRIRILQRAAPNIHSINGGSMIIELSRKEREGLNVLLVHAAGHHTRQRTDQQCPCEPDKKASNKKHLTLYILQKTLKTCFQSLTTSRVQSHVEAEYILVDPHDVGWVLFGCIPAARCQFAHPFLLWSFRDLEPIPYSNRLWFSGPWLFFLPFWQIHLRWNRNQRLYKTSENDFAKTYQIVEFVVVALPIISFDLRTAARSLSARRQSRCTFRSISFLFVLHRVLFQIYRLNRKIKLKCNHDMNSVTKLVTSKFVKM